MFEDEKARIERYKKFEKNNQILDWYEVLTSKKAIIIATLVAILFAIYFEPTKETMKCDKNYVCKIEQQYLWVFPTHKTIRLSKRSKMTTTNDYSFIGSMLSSGKYSHKSKYRGYIYITDSTRRKRSIFTYYTAQRSSRSELKKYMETEKTAFQNYIENPEQEYEIASKADSFTLIFIFTVAFICFVMKKTGISPVGRRSWWRRF